MLDMRRSELAEGDSRMIGSRRREGFLRFETRAADGAGRAELAGGAVPGRLGWRDVRKVAAVLRTWEKSWMVLLVGYYFPMEAMRDCRTAVCLESGANYEQVKGIESKRTVGLIPRNTLFRSPIFLSPS